MNIQAIKGPALIFMAGYFFFYVDHFHKSILAHGYTLAIAALAALVVMTLMNKQKQSAAQPPLLSAEPQQDQHTINLKQPEAVRAK